MNESHGRSHVSRALHDIQASSLSDGELAVK